MTKVINRNNLDALEEAFAAGIAVDIMRPGPYGNPFRVRSMSREEAIRRYELMLKEPGFKPWLAIHLPKLKDKVLVCGCKPLACHGDVLAKLADAL